MEQALFSSSDYVQLFFDLFEASSDAVYIVRMSDGVVLDANASAVSMWGRAREIHKAHPKDGCAKDGNVAISGHAQQAGDDPRDQKGGDDDDGKCG
jgi:hypothetical protein